MALDYKTGLSRYRRYLQVVQEQPLWGASLWLSLTLVLITVMVVVALRPTLVTISGLLGQKRQLTELSERLDKKIAAVTDAEAEYNLLSDKFGLLDQALPKDLSWAVWAEKLLQIASNSGITTVKLELDKMVLAGEEIANVNKSSAPTTEFKDLPAGIKGLTYTITAVGDYDQFREFAADLEMMRRINMITSLSIQKDNKGVLTLKVAGVVGYRI